MAPEAEATGIAEPSIPPHSVAVVVERTVQTRMLLMYQFCTPVLVKLSPSIQ